MTMEEARTLVNGPLWPKVRDDFLATGAFEVYPAGDPRRIRYVDEEVRKAVDEWLEVLSRADELKKVIDGARVRELKERYPGAYPEALRYTMYFARFGAGLKEDPEARKLLLKLKFPEAYAICCS